MKKIGVTGLFFLLLIACRREEKLTAAAIVDKAIAAAGGNYVDQTEICFDFRGKEYIAARKGWRYRLERITADGTLTIRDVLDNDGFERLIDGERIALPDSLAARYANSVNSVHYFAYLPYGLNAPSVTKELLGEVRIKGKTYYKIKVTFSREGGGDDFEDVYLYWIDTETFGVDYLAYKFHVNGGGLRFRQAYNPRVVNGIRFVDYYNFKPKNGNATLYNLERLFQEGELERLSTVALEHIYVQPCTDC